MVLEMIYPAYPLLGKGQDLTWIRRDVKICCNRGPNANGYLAIPHKFLYGIEAMARIPLPNGEVLHVQTISWVGSDNLEEMKGFDVLGSFVFLLSRLIVDGRSEVLLQPPVFFEDVGARARICGDNRL